MSTVKQISMMRKNKSNNLPLESLKLQQNRIRPTTVEPETKRKPEVNNPSNHSKNI
jgi:hypothetical protein